MHQHILLRIINCFCLFWHWSSQGNRSSLREHDIPPDFFKHSYPKMNVFNVKFVAVAMGLTDCNEVGVFVGGCNVALLLECC